MYNISEEDEKLRSSSGKHTLKSKNNEKNLNGTDSKES